LIRNKRHKAKGKEEKRKERFFFKGRMLFLQERERFEIFTQTISSDTFLNPMGAAIKGETV